jgi:hypothetical protein
VSRRSDPDRIYTVRRIAVRNRLVSAGSSEQTAERWAAAREAGPDRQGLERASPDYSKGAAYWIAEEKRAGRPT